MTKKILLLTMFLLLMVAAACQASVPNATTPVIETPASAEPSSEAFPTDVEPTAATEAVTEEATAEVPTVEATAVPSTPEAATPEPVSGGFCPEVTRPALILFVPGEKYVLTNPVTNESCDLPFPETVPGLLQAAGEAPNESLFYQALEDENQLVVHRLSPDGAITPLPFTAIDLTQRGLSYGFVVSADGSKIAWGSSGTDLNAQNTILSDLWVADLATGEVTALVSSSETANPGTAEGLNRSLLPVRFSDDNRVLVFSRQPFGIGGSWNSFAGNYDSLNTIPVTGGEPTEIFDCADEGLFLCIGDFYMFGSDLLSFVYADSEAKSVIARGTNGKVINTWVVEDEYVGYPLLGPAGDVIFYSADLSETSILPDDATLYRAAPINAPSEIVANDSAMMPARMFINDSLAVVGYTDEDGMFGQAVVNIHEQTVTPLSEWPTTIATAVLRAPEPPPQPLQVFGDGVEYLVDGTLARDIRFESLLTITFLSKKASVLTRKRRIGGETP